MLTKFNLAFVLLLLVASARGRLVFHAHEGQDGLPEHHIPGAVSDPGLALSGGVSPEDGIPFGDVSSGEEDADFFNPVRLITFFRAAFSIPVSLSKYEAIGLQEKKSSITCMICSPVISNSISSARAGMSFPFTGWPSGVRTMARASGIPSPRMPIMTAISAFPGMVTSCTRPHISRTWPSTRVRWI